MKPSTRAVKDHLLRHGSITPLQALRQLGIYRLSARILELRESGLGIETDIRVRNGKQICTYRYASKKKPAG